MLTVAGGPAAVRGLGVTEWTVLGAPGEGSWALVGPAMAPVDRQD